MNDFNKIAGCYDLLSECVFGGEIIRSQTYFLDQIKASDSVLILGGGTGKILSYLPACRQIVFLDKSRAMVNTAKKFGSSNSIFLVQDFLAFQSEEPFDVVICPFFLDCFRQETLLRVLAKIKSIIVSNGWLNVTDFQYTRNHPVSILMHLFFKQLANLESNYLKNIHAEVLKSGFTGENMRFFRRKKIFSSVYRNL